MTWSTWDVALAGGLAACILIVRPLYERYLRRDVPVDSSVSPVLGKLRRPVHASHRGGSKAWPENTMLAFRNSARWEDEQGEERTTQMLEFDIQLTKDQEMIIMHNLTVESTTDGTGPVCEMTLQEIRELDAGFRFSSDEGCTFPFRGKGLKVPTLREVLSEFVPLDHLVFYLDFKAPSAVGPALELVKEFGIQERIIMGAVPPAANREVLRLKPPCVPTTPDINSMITMYVFYILGLLWVLPMRHEIVGTTVFRWGFRVLSADMVCAFQKRKRWMAVFGDHIDTEEGQLDCLSLGCDILVTDRPDILHTTLAKMSKPQPGAAVERVLPSLRSLQPAG